MNLLNPSVGIVVLSWNDWKNTSELLESIFKSDYVNYDVIVVDNNSDIEQLSALNFPKIYSVDIETEVIDGFPNPDVARERITCMSIAMQNKQVAVLGWKPISAKQQKEILSF